MREFTQDEIESIVKTMQSSSLDQIDQKIPLRPPGSYGPIAKVEFAALTEELSAPIHERERGRFENLKVHLEVIYGSTTLSLKQLSELQTGSVLHLDNEIKNTVDILANGKKVAQGEIVTLDGHFGIKITAFEEKINP